MIKSLATIWRMVSDFEKDNVFLTKRALDRLKVLYQRTSQFAAHAHPFPLRVTCINCLPDEAQHFDAVDRRLCYTKSRRSPSAPIKLGRAFSQLDCHLR